MKKRVANIRLLLVAACLLLVAAASAGDSGGLRAQSQAGRFEKRCGWFSNPTPGNIWLYDAEGEWTIGVQGGYQLEGDWDWPEFKRGQWVVTNSGDKGYGCACFELRVNRKTHEVLEIKSASARTLNVCRRDRALKKWKRKLD